MATTSKEGRRHRGGNVANREKGENERKEKRRERRKPRNTTIVVSIQPISVERASIHRGSEPARVRMRVRREGSHEERVSERESKKKGQKPCENERRVAKNWLTFQGERGEKGGRTKG